MGPAAVSPPIPHRGELWWADVPGDKVRPVLVLTRARLREPIGQLSGGQLDKVCEAYRFAAGC